MINLEWTLLQEEAQWKACNAMFVRSFLLYYLLIAISSVWLKKERKWLQNLSSLAITLPLHKNVLSNGSALLLERDLSLDNKQDRFHYSLQLLYKKSFMKFNSMLRDKMKEEHQIIKKIREFSKKGISGKALLNWWNSVSPNWSFIEFSVYEQNNIFFLFILRGFKKIS